MSHLDYKLQKTIKEVRGQLRWKVEVTRQGSFSDLEAYSITSGAWNKRHHIFLPPNSVNAPYDYLSELHEYVHALLAETVHPFFSVGKILPSKDYKGTVTEVRGLINEPAWLT